MLGYKRKFLQLAIETGALQFGKFELKSGRRSPYFFDASVFFYGDRLYELSNYYRKAIMAEGLEFDGLLGLAYKGIPLATAVGTSLAKSGYSVPITYNRKEIKNHGEGGVFFWGFAKRKIVSN